MQYCRSLSAGSFMVGAAATAFHAVAEREFTGFARDTARLLSSWMGVGISYGS